MKQNRNLEHVENHLSNILPYDYCTSYEHLTISFVALEFLILMNSSVVILLSK